MAHIVLPYPPQTRNALWLAVRALFGVTIPRVSVCPDHCSPFDAFADAYFRQCTIEDGEPFAVSRVIWHASRGLAGKSKSLSILGLTFGYIDGADITILGGSMAQSSNVHEYMVAGMESENLPLDMTLDQTATKIQLANKGRVRPLPASQRNVRGPHPSVLLCDEVDEMELAIYDAALGQPMPQPGYLGNEIDTMTVISSTWQNADGTFTEILRRAEEQEGGVRTPVYRWCIAAGAIVTTDRGLVPIEQVRTTDRVLTRAGWRQVQHVTFMGHKETVTIRSTGGHSLTCTPDHRVATARGWVEAQALRHGDHGTVVDTLATVPAVIAGIGVEIVPGIGMPVRAVGASQLAAHHLPATDVVAHHVETVAPAGRCDVYDIGVEDAHEFVANGIVVHNCYKESSNPVDGWLTEKTIQEKRDSVSAEMFRIEYDLGEPSIGNRAIDTDKLDEVFVGTNLPIWEKHVKDWDEWRFFDRLPNAVYAAGADWAKEQDKTVISITRTDLPKRELVYTARINRTNYPRMIGVLNREMNYYGVGLNGAWHDSTGLGNVVNDLTDLNARPFHMAGDARTKLLSDYVLAIEKVTWVLPRMLRKYYSEHKFCSTGDLYSQGKTFHLPDTVCSFALAEYGAKRVVNAGAPVVVGKDAPSKHAQQFQHPSETAQSLADQGIAAQAINLVVG